MAKGNKTNESALERQSEPALLILTSLVSGAKHGYALAKDIEAFAGVTLGPGTLYGAITRLDERGLIEAVASDDRRQPYQITSGGRAALENALGEMRALVEEGTSRLHGRRTDLGRTAHPRIAGATS